MLNKKTLKKGSNIIIHSRLIPDSELDSLNNWNGCPPLDIEGIIKVLDWENNKILVSCMIQNEEIDFWVNLHEETSISIRK